MDVALAYIDPGSGSLLIQFLIAGAVAIPLFFRHQIGRIVGRLRRPGTPATETVSANDPERDA